MPSRRAQTYANHIHRPTLAGLVYLFGLAALVGSVAHLLGQRWGAGVALVATSLALLVLATISRVYIVRLQDRIIRSEMRMRVIATCAERLGDFNRLEMPQIVALRFASDAELPGLISRAVSEKLSNTDIKRAIKEWVPDYHRT